MNKQMKQFCEENSILCVHNSSLTALQLIKADCPQSSCSIRKRFL